MKHYKFGGSVASRDIGCNAWRKLASSLPKRDSGGEHADRGTCLHGCMEKLAKDDELDYLDLTGETYKSFTLDSDTLTEVVIPTFERFMGYAEQQGFQTEDHEVTVELDSEVGGTADVLATNPTTVFVLDFKFGYNLVSPEENAQGLFYAMAAMEDEKTKHLFEGRDRIVVGIIQPQYEAEGQDMIQTWECDKAHLVAFVSSYLDAIEMQEAVLADNLTPSPTAGDHCSYCPAMSICPVKTGQARAALMIKPDSQDAETLARALSMADEVIAWAKSVQKLAHEQAELGLRLNGFKLVDKRAIRKWTQEVEVLDMVRKAKKIKLEEATDLKLKSPAQLEKVCKKLGVDFVKYAYYIDAVSSGTTLVHSDDKRPEAFSVAALAAALKESA
jgi:hypothetical protein